MPSLFVSRSVARDAFKLLRLLLLLLSFVCLLACLLNGLLSITNGLTYTRTIAHTFTATILYNFGIAKWFPVCFWCGLATAAPQSTAHSSLHFSLYLWFDCVYHCDCTQNISPCPFSASLHNNIVVFSFPQCVQVSKFRLENDFIHTRIQLFW